MSEDYTKLVINLLKRHNLNVTNVNDSFHEYSTIKERPSPALTDRLTTRIESQCHNRL
ncbi:39951_t:CDS:2 [Gigaspora margarita]|uniref:39951_t:CDS:1 n=1 Tax=Gigaspora margarita TaxID=4874 RepID=A0ABM8W6W0_GIGMA|nr:39951_t:CDS:2 [Gigaspora margarita]